MRNMKKMMHGDKGINRCPLSGATKAVMMVDGAAMLVIGTEECTYYTKSSLEMKGDSSNCFSVVLDKNDITFGSLDTVSEAVYELLDEYKPTALFLITTCVVEIIGDDFTALALEASAKYNLPVKVIQTNHYKGKDDEYGMDLVFDAAKDLGQKPHKFNNITNMIGNKIGSKANMSRSTMSEEEMFQMLKAKTGGRMSDKEIRKKIHSKMGGR
ncbi:nitrogenase component 1 [Tannockella kyphosi]|uniref:nitrogenase component 1 n=1 Tax=Tannockella kyphosi TaxID=2899121 RepID=UPI002012278A|nr:nitrogenase component 1 [Tannockella kyphosi]